MLLCSWNVNGLRAVLKTTLPGFLETHSPDVLCLQEIKATEAQAAGLWSHGYHAHWNPAERPGYSGTLTLTKTPVLSVTRGVGVPEGDCEGRVITTEFPDFFLVNVYTPNAKGDLSRLKFRHKLWDPAFLEHCSRLRDRKPVLFCGDLNVAHTELDLARPKDNVGYAGFTDEEREGFAKMLEAGFHDTFRHFKKEGGHYSWWTYRAGARERNIGWRIDYFLADNDLRKRLHHAEILPHVTGSDHCPVTVKIDA